MNNPSEALPTRNPIRNTRMDLQRPWPTCQSSVPREYPPGLQIPLCNRQPLPLRHHAAKILSNLFLHQSLHVAELVPLPDKHAGRRRLRDRMAPFRCSIYRLPVHPDTERLAAANAGTLPRRQPVVSREYYIQRRHRRIHHAPTHPSAMEPAHGPRPQNGLNRLLLLRLLVSALVIKSLEATTNLHDNYSVIACSLGRLIVIVQDSATFATDMTCKLPATTCNLLSHIQPQIPPPNPHPT